jgi:hypothetical protein
VDIDSLSAAVSAAPSASFRGRCLQPVHGACSMQRSQQIAPVLIIIIINDKLGQHGPTTQETRPVFLARTDCCFKGNALQTETRGATTPRPPPPRLVLCRCPVQLWFSNQLNPVHVHVSVVHVATPCLCALPAGMVRGDKHWTVHGHNLHSGQCKTAAIASDCRLLHAVCRQQQPVQVAMG